jgi:hypothetical protein
MSTEDRTSVYIMQQADVCPMETKKVPDLETGGTRNRKHAVYCSIGIIPELVGHRDPIILQGEMPKLLVDGDTLAEIKERLYSELDSVFNNAQDVLDGKVTTEQLEEKAIKEYEELVKTKKETKIQVPE